jgi:predicted enzyme related to lactoylglutathione lyase
MIKSLALVSIWSADLNNLLPFYRDVLGLTAGDAAPGFVVLSGSHGIALGLGTHSDVRGKNTDPARHIVSLAVDDCAAEYARLKAAGVDFIEAPNRPGPDAPTIATFRDPEGNLVQLSQFHEAG